MWKYYIFRLAHALLGRLPVQVPYGIARVAGDAAYYLRAGARAAVIDNMRHVMGPGAPERDVHRAAREAFRNVARYYADMIHVPHIDAERFARERLTIDGLEHVIAARDSGRGAVVAGAHFGNPEMAVQGLPAHGVFLFILTEPLKPQALADFTQRLRVPHGHEYRTISLGAVRETVRRLRAGGLIAIMMDRDTGDTGVPIEFCGEVTKMPLGAVELAVRSGADLIVASSLRLPGYRFHITISPPLDRIRTGDFDADVRASARQVLDLFEEQIRSQPGQWAVLERIWPEKRDES